MRSLRGNDDENQALIGRHIISAGRLVCKRKLWGCLRTKKNKEKTLKEDGSSSQNYRRQYHESEFTISSVVIKGLAHNESWVMATLQPKLSLLVPARDGVFNVRIRGVGLIQINGTNSAENGESCRREFINGEVVGRIWKSRTMVIHVLHEDADAQVVWSL